MKIINVNNLPSFSKEIELIELKDQSQSFVNFFESVQAGFPSPADDYQVKKLSLDERYLSKNNSTFIVKVAGNSMNPTLIEKDFLIVRSDLNIEDGQIGIFSVNNSEFTVKRLDTKRSLLIADNKNHKNITISESDTIISLGRVVTLFREFINDG